MQFIAHTLSAAVAVLLAVAPVAGAQDAAPASPPVWDGHVARIGAVTVDPQTRTLTASGWVNQVSGPIELLACGPGGKTHESVFVLNANAVDLQSGILLLGFKPGRPPSGLGTGRPEGPGLEIRVEWDDGTGRKSERAERFVYNVKKRKALPETPWVFTGSVIEDGEFKALAEESYIVTYWDPWAILNIPLDCGANDEILFVNEKLVPAVKTPVTFRIREHQKKGPWWLRWKRK